MSLHNVNVNKYNNAGENKGLLMRQLLSDFHYFQGGIVYHVSNCVSCIYLHRKIKYTYYFFVPLPIKSWLFLSPEIDFQTCPMLKNCSGLIHHYQ